jgi:hypothetical protein
MASTRRSLGVAGKVGTIVTLPLKLTRRGVEQLAGVTSSLLTRGEGFVAGAASNVDETAGGLFRGGKRNHKNKTRKNRNHKNKSRKNRNHKNRDHKERDHKDRN